MSRPPANTHAPRILLVECLDGAGSDPSDASDRARALSAAGAHVRVALLDGSPLEDAPVALEGAAPSVLHLRRDRGVRPALERLIAADRVECVIFATADSSRVPWPRLRNGTEGRVWLTGAGGRPSGLARLFAREEPALAAMGEVADSWLTLGLVERPPSRSTLSLWDGDYVLVPTAPIGRPGGEVLRAFAELADDWTGHDLVILGDHEPELERLARDLGVGMRVHFVGIAERQAEWAWWTHAAAAVLTSALPISGGRILRALACGCPLHISEERGAGGPAADWLARQDCVPERAAGESLAGAIERLLERGPEVEHSVERGRAVAAAHDFGTLVSHLRATVPGLAMPSSRKSIPHAA